MFLDLECGSRFRCRCCWYEILVLLGAHRSWGWFTTLWFSIRSGWISQWVRKTLVKSICFFWEGAGGEMMMTFWYFLCVAESYMFSEIRHYFDDLQIKTVDVEAFFWGPWLQDCSETTWTEGSSRSPWHHLGQRGEMSQFLVEMCFSDVLNDKCSFRINWWPKEKNPKIIIFRWMIG